MIQPDRDGMVPCPCGAQRHFAKPCPHCAGPNPAVLPPPGVAVGASDAVQRRMEADGARTAASGPQKPVARAAGFEPAASGFGDRRSSQLSHARGGTLGPRTPHGDREWGGS